MRFSVFCLIGLSLFWRPLVPTGSVALGQAEPQLPSDEPAAAGSLASKPSRTTAAPSEEADEIQDIVFLAPDGPIVIRTRNRVLDRGFRGFRSRYAGSLFRSLDGDGDGVLQGAEIRGIPPSDRLLPPRLPHEDLRSFSRAPVDADADGKVSLGELAEYLQRSIGSPFAFKLAPPARANEVDLFDIVDANGDGTLDDGELHSLERAVLRLDANDDEIVDPGELSTDPRWYAVRNAPTDLSTQLLSQFVAVDPETGAIGLSLFQQLVERYDKPKPSSGSAAHAPTADGRLDAGELRASPEQFAKWDGNGDGFVGPAEARLIHDLFPALELSITLLGSASRISAKPLAAAAAVADSADGRHLELVLGGKPFDLTIGACLDPIPEVRARFDGEFDGADRDNNGYLGVGEARQLGITDSGFPAFDDDLDGMVTKREFLLHVELEALLFGSRVEVQLAHEPESVLDLIDDGADRQLGLRELHQAADRLLSWDTNGDGRIQSGEIPSNSRLVWRNSETALFRQDPRRTNTRRRAVYNAPVPSWFRKMDRNRDGDVSQREFLGRLETFELLDTDSNGLLAPTEAPP